MGNDGILFFLHPTSPRFGTAYRAKRVNFRATLPKPSLFVDERGEKKLMNFVILIAWAARIRGIYNLSFVRCLDKLLRIDR